MWPTHRVKFNVRELNLIPPLCSLSHTPQGEGGAHCCSHVLSRRKSTPPPRGLALSNAMHTHRTQLPRLALLRGVPHMQASKHLPKAGCTPSLHQVPPR